ncbi:glycosyltransferase family 2 protein [Pontibacter ramchanderi]|uniref:Glycosyltransferase involved in cell wall biosynthesis n=1 Tax=Pontibacter ramchanderi TaxID=1179743 RepID=A0A2N3V0N7_9BACT|nr:glycosyltransferase family 2 protein [Pontibacter ramchanderi]PKV75178.1 glycosyltransferase involved in cell wall biosynthesis [Pontibacter ramchanderi]
MVNEFYSEAPLKSTLTILVPVYNEAECLLRLSEALDAFLPQSPMPAQVLFINDGSTDNSLHMMREICARRQHYGYISLSQNKGLSTAIKAGIDHCQSTYIGYIDADLQTSPLDFLLFFEHLPEYEMVCGIRMKRKDTFVKKISSRIANGFRRRMINDGIVDTGCPLKIVDAAYAKRVPFFDGMHRFLPALIQLQGGRVKQVPVQHFERYAGTSKYHLFNRIWGPLNDTFAFRWMRKRYISYTIAEQSVNKTAAQHEQV